MQPYRRVDIKRRCLVPKKFLAYEIVLTAEQTTFHLAFPTECREFLDKQIAVTWPRTTAKDDGDPLAELPAPNQVGRLELASHYIFPLRADGRRSSGVLPSLLETIRMLGADERVVIQAVFEPVSPNWWEHATPAYEQLREGKAPKRLRVDGKTIGLGALKLGTKAVLEAISIASELFTGKPMEAIDLEGSKAVKALRDDKDGNGVASKLKDDALDLTLHVAVFSESDESAKNLLRSVLYSYRSLDGDNSFNAIDLPASSGWPKMVSRTPGFKLNPDIVSVKEAAMMFQLPTGPMQEEFGLRSVTYREVKLPQTITQTGLRIGDTTYHGQRIPVFLPTDSHDELCLPHVVIGEMGTGKTSFGAVLAIEAVRNGMGAVIIDPAKGEAGDELALALPPEKIVRIRFGSKPYCIDWREVSHGDPARSRNRFANELIQFCEAATDEAGAQTVRFLRAAAKVAQTGKLSEVIKIVTDAEYVRSLLPGMREQERITWDQFLQSGDKRQNQMATPIMNRLDVIMGDDYLCECMDATEGIDFVELVKEPRAVVIDVPKEELGAEALDVIVALISTKLDLAMAQRSKADHPVFIVQDEPHQYLRSSKTWRRVAVESRKHRFSYVWSFHAWEQIPNDVAAIIQAAGPHYHLYKSSKKTYNALAEEIKPFELDDALRTPRHWALNIIKAGGKTMTPFLAKMDPPPSAQKQRKDR